MQSDWDCYLCELNDWPAAILVDLAYGESDPPSDLPYRLQMRIRLKSPREDGFPTQEEMAELAGVDDALEDAFTSLEDDVRLVGRITSNGCRDYFCYCRQPHSAQRAMEEAMQAFPAYSPQFTVQDDPDWDLYYQVLYPSDFEMKIILTTRLLRMMEQEGDPLEVERDIRHWIYFPSENSRRQFIEQVERGGFSSEPISSDENPNLPFGVIVTRRQPAGYYAVLQVMAELHDLCEQYQGEYDGWEAPRVAPDAGDRSAR